jgi:O-acetyl-ADP-ribose deacetylase (regulator of RNase III)
MDKLQVKNSTISLTKGDITDLEIESFVYYAREDLQLGSGFGNAIAMRGGRSIQEELKALGPAKTTDAVVTSAGEMKAEYIIHAVGPKFQEEGLEEKMRATVLNVLKLADEKNIKKVAFPPMGAGFYGVPLDLSAELTIETIRDYLTNQTQIEEVSICLLDSREYMPFQKKLNSLPKQ